MMYSEQLSRYLDSHLHTQNILPSNNAHPHNTGSHVQHSPHQFSGYGAASIAVSTHNNTGNNPIDNAVSQKLLVSHRGRKKIALDPSKAVHCAECMKQFSHDFHLKIHMRSHTGERPYECTVCLKRFTQKGNLDTHMRKHTGDRPFKCEVCNRGFTQKGNMETHMRLHTGEKPFQCPLCSKRFYQQGGLRNHKCVTDHHMSPDPSRQERRGRKATYASSPEMDQSLDQRPLDIVPKQEHIPSLISTVGSHPTDWYQQGGGRGPVGTMFTDMFIKQEQDVNPHENG